MRLRDCCALAGIAFAVLSLAVSPSRGGTEKPLAKCTAKTATLAKEAGISAERHALSEISTAVNKGSYQLLCPGSALVLTYPSEYPPEAFYDLLSEIAARTVNETPDKMRLRVHRCHRAAKRSSNGHGAKRFGSFHLDCDRHLSRSTFSLRPISNE